ncbi:MAG: hypothetical protein II278_04295 [Bacteroidaceae bacterium]|jgi:hypothetical protein|nr:hypothetical protein [Bacteroidaceae bacterium]
MNKLKKIFFVLSFLFLVLGFGVSVWLYTVLHDMMSIVMMGLLFVAMLWFGYNVVNLLRDKE